MISPKGELTTEQLGLDIAHGEKPLVLVPKNYIFGSAMNKEGYALAAWYHRDLNSEILSCLSELTC
jgi:predicted cupin superfamily sugar epimerase